jgi:hypothetical protein
MRHAELQHGHRPKNSDCNTEELVDWEHLDTLERNPEMLVRDTSFLPAPLS